MPRKNVSDNAACWCGSELKYKYCHRDIDSVGPHQRVTMAHRVYEKSWSANSANIDLQGGYEWMVTLLKQYQPKRIFDVGCGVGTGIQALINLLGDRWRPAGDFGAGRRAGFGGGQPGTGGGIVEGGERTALTVFIRRNARGV